MAHFSFVSSPFQGGSRRKALAFALTFAGSLQGQTALTDLHLSGTNNQITNGAEMTVLSGGSVTAAAGSVIDLFHATVALPPALTLRNLRLDGASTELINGARLTLLNGSTFATAPGSTMDLSSADISFPTTVVLTTGEQTLTGKTFVSPIISAISAPASSNLSLTAGSAGASLTLGAGADASASFTGLRLVLADGPYTSDYVSVPNMFIGLGAGKAGNRSRANIGIGINALGNATTASENIAIGWNALAMTDGIPPAAGSHMIAIGPQALEQNTTGGDHVAIGRRSMQNNTTGVDNTAVGYESLSQNTVGSYNVALGNIALQKNTTGYHSVAVGQSALTSAVSSENTAVGANAGFRTTTGTRNVFVGFNSAWENIGGSRNTAIGENSLVNAQSNNNTAVGSATGETLTTGGNNTFLGAKTNVSSSSMTNVTAIGFQAMATASNQIALGNENVTQVRLGAGPIVAFGDETPEGVVSAPVSSLFLRKNGASGTALYVKESTNGTGTTGWTPVTTGIGGTAGNILVNGGIVHQAGTVVLSLPKALTSIRGISSDTGALVLNGASGIVRVDDNASYGGAEFFVNGGNIGFALLRMVRLNASNPAKINFYTGVTQKWDWGLDGDGTDNLMIYNRSTGVYPFRMWAADNSLSLYGSADAAMDGSGALKVGGGIFAGKKIVSATDLVAGGNIVAAGGVFSGTSFGLTLNSGQPTQPIVFKLGTNEIARLSGTTGNLLLGGTTDMAGSAGLKVFGTTNSTSATTGALQVVGGAGIGDALFVGSTNDSTSTETGSFVVAGGAAIRKKVFIGDDMVLSPTASAASTVRLSGTAVANTPGIWFRDGGSPTAANAALSATASATIVNGPASGSVNLRIANTTYVQLNPTGLIVQTLPLKVNTTTASTSSTTGSATFAGGVGVAGRASVGALNVGTGTTITGIVSTTAALTFPSVAGNGGTQNLTVTVNGAAVGDDVNIVEVDGNFISAGIVLRAIVTSVNTVTVRATNVTSATITPAAGTFRVTVTRF